MSDNSKPEDRLSPEDAKLLVDTIADVEREEADEKEPKGNE